MNAQTALKNEVTLQMLMLLRTRNCQINIISLHSQVVLQKMTKLTGLVLQNINTTTTVSNMFWTEQEM
jgi:hypothetical protein